MTTTTTTDNTTFPFPKHHSFPPFYTLQPTHQTLQAQLKKWSTTIQSYCRHHKIFQLSIVSAATTPLFSNSTIKKHLSESDIKTVIEYMSSVDGDGRAEWVDSATKTSAWIWWRKPEEWGGLIAGWVEETGQKGTVLTLYEIVDGEGTEGLEFHGMDMDILRKTLGLLAKKGKAQVFGSEDQQGVKFF